MSLPRPLVLKDGQLSESAHAALVPPVPASAEQSRLLLSDGSGQMRWDSLAAFESEMAARLGAGGIISGALSPDAVTEPALRARLDAAPAGTLYASANRANGAPVYVRTPHAWRLMLGDTRWRKLNSLIDDAYTAHAGSAGLFVRRVADQVTLTGNALSVSAGAARLLWQAASGFAPSRKYGNGPQTDIRDQHFNTKGQAGFVGFAVHVGAIEPLQQGYFSLTWLTDAPWPDVLPGQAS